VHRPLTPDGSRPKKDNELTARERDSLDKQRQLDKDASHARARRDMASQAAVAGAGGSKKPKDDE